MFGRNKSTKTKKGKRHMWSRNKKLGIVAIILIAAVIIIFLAIISVAIATAAAAGTAVAVSKIITAPLEAVTKH